MLKNEKLVAFVATTNAARARKFYEGTLGLTVKSDDDIAHVLDAGGTTIRVQKVREATIPPYTALGWEVADIHATVEALITKGVTFERFAKLELDALGIWAAPGGARVAWLKDPDGNVLSLSSAG
jgi:catechol 2,3-dioxygenase-like lactoylglutathione lyase family enzyme